MARLTSQQVRAAMVAQGASTAQADALLGAERQPRARRSYKSPEHDAMTGPKGIAHALRTHPRVVFYARIHGGGGMVEGKGGEPVRLHSYRIRIVRKYNPDVVSHTLTDYIGMLTDGRWFLCEAKADGKDATPAQSAMMRLVRRFGGPAFVARCAEDVTRGLA